jgi:hypothetical protein
MNTITPFLWFDDTGTSRKEAAMAFLRLAASGKAREAFQSYVAPGFRNHDPFFGSDADSLIIAMEEHAAKNPNKVLEVQRTRGR